MEKLGKVIHEQPWWLGGTMQFLDTGDRKYYAVWHKENEVFMGWMGKEAVKHDMDKSNEA